MNEPNILKEIKNHKFNGVFADTKNEIIPFLKSQFDYEIQRCPQHRLFKTVYQLSYFDAAKFLNYWINPTGIGMLFKYRIDEYTECTPVIYKFN